jgi:hypothetical protein
MKHSTVTDNRHTSRRGKVRRRETLGCPSRTNIGAELSGRAQDRQREQITGNDDLGTLRVALGDQLVCGQTAVEENVW